MSAAPSSFNDEPTVIGERDDVMKNLDTLAQVLKCVVTGAGRLVGGSDFKKKYQVFKTKTDGLLNDIKKCTEVQDLEELSK